MIPAVPKASTSEKTDHGALLSVRDLQVEFRTGQRIVRAVNGVSIDVRAGQTTAVLGESGSGKSVTFEAVLGILDSPPAVVMGGAAYFHGQDLFALPPAQRRAICGRRIGMIFQDPLSSLNPVYTVGWQVAEMLRVHLGASRHDAHQRAIALLRQVGIPDAPQRVSDYPHQFSGGMRQRVVIAMALAGNPELIIADEPTTALDVTIEAQVLRLLRRLQTEHGMGLVMITHSMGVVAEIADSVTVMYAGEVMEGGPVRDILKRPAHPYTRGLLRSVPRRGRAHARLVPIAGKPPDLAKAQIGCPYQPRCDFARDICAAVRPALRVFDDGRRTSACHFVDEVLDAK